MADRSTQARTVGAQGGAATSAGSADGAVLACAGDREAPGAGVSERPGIAGAAVRGTAPAVPPVASGPGRSGRTGERRLRQTGQIRPQQLGEAAERLHRRGRARARCPAPCRRVPTRRDQRDHPSPHPARTCRPPRSPRPGTSPSGPRHRRASAARPVRPASRPGSCGHDPAGTARVCQGRSGAPRRAARRSGRSPPTSTPAASSAGGSRRSSGPCPTWSASRSTASCSPPAR